MHRSASVKTLLAGLLLLCGAVSAHAQAVPISQLPRITAPDDSDLAIVEHFNGPAGQHTSGIALSDFATYLSAKLGYGGFIINQAPNSVMAGPASGSAAVPAFRALVDADIPQIYAKNAAAAITGGTIDGTPIGGAAPSTGAFTTTSITTETVGTQTVGTGTFTTALTSSGAFASSGSSFFATNTTSVPAAALGLYITDNQSGGGGETDLWNGLAAATASFRFNQITGAGTFSTLLTLTPSAATFAQATSLPTGSTAPTQTANDNSTKIASTAYVDAARAAYLPLAGGTMTGAAFLFTGTTAPTQTAGDNTTKLATDAFVTTATAAYLPLAGGTMTGAVALFTGTTAPTQAANDNSTKVASTAYVDTARAAYLPLAGGTMTGPLNHKVSATVSAAGTTQGTATALTSDINVVTTAAASSGVILQANIGERQEVFNRGANALAVYPPSGAKIEAVATNGSVSLPITTGHGSFVCVTATQCYQSP